MGAKYLEKKNGLMIDKKGCMRWYLNDKLHRENGPAVILNGGSKQWWIDGKRHRLNGPAIELNTTYWWFVDNISLGTGDKGFWNLWELLSNEQRSDLDLLMWLPKL